MLSQWLPGRLAALKQRLLDPADARVHIPAEISSELRWLVLVLGEIRELVRQRRDPSLLPLLGDADALAERCYQPVIDFARAEGLPLTTARPVCELTDFDLALWTGFAPTSLAPLFLPAGFFDRCVWWPALGHEIGHDFLVSVPGLRDRLARELQLPNEQSGSLPLVMVNNSISSQHLWRIHGGWLEELFADVFGTLMCGPAYAATMVELFSYRSDPREVLVVPIDPNTRRHDPHPPRHVRIHAACAVLERTGFFADAERILASWYARNQLAFGEPAPLYFLVDNEWLALPDAAVLPLTRQLVERLYAGPFDALNGFGLEDISGLDYGPSEHQAALGAKADLLAGRVPGNRDVRAVIAGAVLASLEAPEQDAQLLERARKAIPAVGTAEVAPSGYSSAEPGRAAPGLPGLLDLSPDALTQALVLREILQR